MTDTVQLIFIAGPRKGERVWGKPTFGGYSVEERDGTLTLLAHSNQFRLVRSFEEIIYV